MRELLERLCALNAVSSWEDEVRAFLLAEVEPHADRLRVDALGNLIAWKKGRKHTGSKLLLTAHMDEVGLMIRQITDDGRLFGLFGQGLQRVVDFAGLDAAGLEPVRKQVELGLEIEVTACIQCQGLFFGGIRELADLTFSLCLLDEYGAVIGDASESLGGFDISLGEAGAGGCRSRVGRSLLGECGGGWGVRLHRCRAWNGRFAGLGCGRRRLLGDFIGVLGRGDILVGHGLSVPFPVTGD